MDFIRSVRDSNSEHWSEALQWLLWNVIGGLVPIWLPLIIIYFFQQKISLSIFTDHGEFALYSASFLGTALYVVLKDFHIEPFPNRSIITIILFILLLISTLIFSLVALTEIFYKVGITRPYDLLHRESLRTVSSFLLPAACVFSLFIFVVDLVRIKPDISGIKDKDFKGLNADFDKLKD
jgi:hypothetical protein